MRPAVSYPTCYRSTRCRSGALGAVTAAAGTPFSAAAGALRGLAGLSEGRFYAGGALVPEEATLGLPPLLDGTMLTVGGRGAPTALPGSLKLHSGLELHVIGGPD